MVTKKVDIRTNRWTVVFCTFVSRLQKWPARACRNHSVAQNEPRKPAGTILRRGIGRANLRGAFTVREWPAQTRADHFLLGNGPRGVRGEAFTVLEWFAQLRFVPFAFGEPRCSGRLRFYYVAIALLYTAFACHCFCKYSLFVKIKTELCKKKYQQIIGSPC